MVVGSTLLLIAHRITINVSVEQLAEAQSGRAAVDSIVRIATSLLNELAWAWLSLGVLIVVYALLVGPSRAATAVRRFVAPVMINAFGAWALAIGVLVLYLVLAPGFSIDRWIPLLVFAALFVTAVELLRRQVTTEHRLSAASDES
jgi:hypothetical protein